MLSIVYRLQPDHVIKRGSLNVIKLKTHSLTHYKSLVATLEPSEKLRGLKININRAHSEYSKILFSQFFAFFIFIKITNQNIKLNQTTLKMKILKKYIFFVEKFSNFITKFCSEIFMAIFIVEIGQFGIKWATWKSNFWT